MREWLVEVGSLCVVGEGVFCFMFEDGMINWG